MKVSTRTNAVNPLKLILEKRLDKFVQKHLKENPRKASTQIVKQMQGKTHRKKMKYKQPPPAIGKIKRRTKSDLNEAVFIQRDSVRRKARKILRPEKSLPNLKKKSKLKKMRLKINLMLEQKKPKKQKNKKLNNSSRSPDRKSGHGEGSDRAKYPQLSKRDLERAQIEQHNSQRQENLPRESSRTMNLSQVNEDEINEDYHEPSLKINQNTNRSRQLSIAKIKFKPDKKKNKTTMHKHQSRRKFELRGFDLDRRVIQKKLSQSNKRANKSSWKKCLKSPLKYSDLNVRLRINEIIKTLKKEKEVKLTNQINKEKLRLALKTELVSYPASDDHRSVMIPTKKKRVPHKWEEIENTKLSTEEVAVNPDQNQEMSCQSDCMIGQNHVDEKEVDFSSIYQGYQEPVEMQGNNLGHRKGISFFIKKSTKNTKIGPKKKRLRVKKKLEDNLRNFQNLTKKYYSMSNLRDSSSITSKNLGPSVAAEFDLKDPEKFNQLLMRFPDAEVQKAPFDVLSNLSSSVYKSKYKSSKIDKARSHRKHNSLLNQNILSSEKDIRLGKSVPLSKFKSKFPDGIVSNLNKKNKISGEKVKKTKANKPSEKKTEKKRSEAEDKFLESFHTGKIENFSNFGQRKITVHELRKAKRKLGKPQSLKIETDGIEDYMRKLYIAKRPGSRHRVFNQ